MIAAGRTGRPGQSTATADENSYEITAHASVSIGKASQLIGRQSISLYLQSLSINNDGKVIPVVADFVSLYGESGKTIKIAEGSADVPTIKSVEISFEGNNASYELGERAILTNVFYYDDTINKITGYDPWFGEPEPHIFGISKPSIYDNESWAYFLEFVIAALNDTKFSTVKLGWQDENWVDSNNLDDSLHQREVQNALRRYYNEYNVTDKNLLASYLLFEAKTGKSYILSAEYDIAVLLSEYDIKGIADQYKNVEKNKALNKIADELAEGIYESADMTLSILSALMAASALDLVKITADIAAGEVVVGENWPIYNGGKMLNDIIYTLIKVAGGADEVIELVKKATIGVVATYASGVAKSMIRKAYDGAVGINEKLGWLQIGVPILSDAEKDEHNNIDYTKVSFKTLQEEITSMYEKISRKEIGDASGYFNQMYNGDQILMVVAGAYAEKTILLWMQANDSTLTGNGYTGTAEERLEVLQKLFNK
jgi:hypothetical protein